MKIEVRNYYAKVGNYIQIFPTVVFQKYSDNYLLSTANYLSNIFKMFLQITEKNSIIKKDKFFKLYKGLFTEDTIWNLSANALPLL